MKRLLLFLIAGAAMAQTNAVMMPWTPQQFTNTNGTLLVSGKVCTYLAGTSTGTATFTDSTASVQNAIPPNAILLDSTARPTSGGIWLTPGKAYKIVTMTAGSDGTCSTGVVVKTQDNVIATNGAGLSTNNTFTGTNTFQGLIQCKNFEGTRCVDTANSAAWAGADVCAWITSAQLDLPSTGGTIRVADGNYPACAAGFTVGSSTKPVSIYLGMGATAGGVLITVNAQIVLACSNCTVSGVAGSATTIFQGASFPANTPVIQIGNGSGVTATQVNYVRVDCNGGTTSIGFQNANGLDFSGFSWDIASGCTKYGFWYEGTGGTASLSIGEKLWSTHTGTATIGFYIHNVNNFRGTYLTSTARNGTDVIPQGILVDGGNASIDSVHCENDTVCLDIGTTTAAIIYGRNFIGNGTSATLIKIENTASNRVSLFNVITNGSTNAIQDALVGEAIITDTWVARYDTLLGPTAILEKGDGKLTQFTAETRWANPTLTIDGRMGPGSFSSAGLGFGTASNSIVDIFSNSSVGASVEFNGTNSNIKIPTFIRDLETTAPAGIPSSTVLYADSTAHNLRVNMNNTGFGPVVTAAPCTTSQKTENAADTNLLTCAIAAQAGSYRIRFIMDISAANSATLGWTATWTDSNGTAAAPTNLPIQALGAATTALTVTTSAVGELYGYADISVNNSGTSVVIKTTFSGTSFTAKASATVERII